MTRNPQSGIQNSHVLRIEHLKKYFPVKRGFLARSKEAVRAVDGVSLSLAEKETLGLVGESGCGKTTLGRLVVRILKPTAGSIYFKDSPDLATLEGRELLPYRRRIQMIFQDPFSSLNPRMMVGAIVGEALTIHGLAKGRQKWRRVGEILQSVGLKPEHAERFPHEFSGGQRQRIGIARALAVEPDIIIADEPVSALDVSIQAQIINLLQELQERIGLAFIFISHDLSVVGHVSHRVAVMYLGRIVEIGNRNDIFSKPLHPYTQALLLAVPKTHPKSKRKRITLEGDVPSPIAPPPGCPFHPRCPRRFDACDKVVPRLLEHSAGHKVACLLYEKT